MNFNDLIDQLIKLAIDEEEINYIRMHKQRWFDILELISKLPLNKIKNIKVLDIGIGGGWISFLIKRLFNYDIYGVDIKREETQRWVDRFNSLGIKFSICDITKEKLPYSDNTFDMILFLEVLEHLITSHPPWHVFYEIGRVMKPGSFLILSTPNAVALHKRMMMLLGKNPFHHGFKDKRSYKKHFREYTVEELKVLEECGFKIEKICFKNYGFLTSNMILKLLSLYPRFRDTIIVVAKKNL